MTDMLTNFSQRTQHFSAAPPAFASIPLTYSNLPGATPTDANGAVKTVDNPYLAFFGPMPQTYQGPQYGRSVENKDLFEAYVGKNAYVSEVMITRITKKDQWPVTELLPWRRMDGAQKIVWTRWNFEDTSMDHTPEESVSRVLMSHQEGGEVALQRYGKGLIMELGFYRTKQGQINYLRHIDQISNALIETNCMGALYQCYQAAAYLPGYLPNSKAQGALSATEFDAVLKREVLLFGITQKFEQGVSIMYQTVKRELESSRGVTPSMLVMPEDTWNKIVTLPGGKDGVVHYGNLPNDNGLRVRYTRNFRVVEKGMKRNNDPAYQVRCIGEVMCMLNRDSVAGIPAAHYRTEQRDITVYDYRKDDYQVIQFGDALDHAGLYDENLELTAIGTRFVGPATDNWLKWLERTGGEKDAVGAIVSSATTLAAFSEFAADYFVDLREPGGDRMRRGVVAGHLRPQQVTHETGIAEAGGNRLVSFQGIIDHLDDYTGLGHPSLFLDHHKDAVLEVFNQYIVTPTEKSQRALQGKNNPVLTKYADDIKDGGYLWFTVNDSIEFHNASLRSTGANWLVNTANVIRLITQNRDAMATDAATALAEAYVGRVVFRLWFAFFAAAYEQLYAQRQASSDQSGITKFETDVRKLMQGSAVLVRDNPSMTFFVSKLAYKLDNQSENVNGDYLSPEGVSRLHDGCVSLVNDEETRGQLDSLLLANEEDTLAASRNVASSKKSRTERAEVVLSDRIQSLQATAADLDHDGGAGDAKLSVAAKATAMEHVRALIEQFKMPRASFLKFCVRNNVPLKGIDLLLFRPHMRFVCGSALLCRAGEELGITAIANADFRLGIDPDRKMLHAHFTVNTARMLTNPGLLQMAPNIQVRSYVGGGGTEFWKYTKRDQKRYQMGEMAADIFVVAVPGGYKLNRDCIDITGYFNKDIYGGRNDQQYPTSDLYAKEFWGWNHGIAAGITSYRSAPMHTDRGNTICFVGFYKHFEHSGNGRGTMSRVVVNKGHTGPDITPGYGRIWSGGISRIPQSTYRDAYPHNN